MSKHVEFAIAVESGRSWTPIEFAVGAVQGEPGGGRERGGKEVGCPGPRVSGKRMWMAKIFRVFGSVVRILEFGLKIVIGKTCAAADAKTLRSAEESPSTIPQILSAIAAGKLFYISFFLKAAVWFLRVEKCSVRGVE